MATCQRQLSQSTGARVGGVSICSGRREVGRLVDLISWYGSSEREEPHFRGIGGSAMEAVSQDEFDEFIKNRDQIQICIHNSAHCHSSRSTGHAMITAT